MLAAVQWIPVGAVVIKFEVLQSMFMGRITYGSGPFDHLQQLQKLTSNL